jgi:hypothetical protein
MNKRTPGNFISLIWASAAGSPPNVTQKLVGRFDILRTKDVMPRCRSIIDRRRQLPQ